MFDFAPIRCRVFGISPIETQFARRGFAPADPNVQRHLETAGGSFIEGYNTALAEPRWKFLGARLNQLDATFRGFAFEGAAMALALLDIVTPWNRRRLKRFIDSPAGDANWYMLHIGAGWAMARIPWKRRNFERAFRSFHPLYRLLLLDGYGFHEAYFYTQRYVTEQVVPRGLSDHAVRVFDQGLGRSLWFSQGASPERIAAAIGAFSTSRQADLWSGAGLAASYAGGVDHERLTELRDHAGQFAVHLAQGAAFAAKARLRAGNPTAHTDMACEVFCHMPAAAAAGVTDMCLVDLPPDGAEPAYQLWRARIRQRFSENETGSRLVFDRTPPPLYPARR